MLKVNNKCQLKYELSDVKWSGCTHAGKSHFVIKDALFSIQTYTRMRNT